MYIYIRTWPAGHRACLALGHSTFHSFPSFFLLHLTHSPPSNLIPYLYFSSYFSSLLFFRFLQVIYLKVDEWGVLGSRAVEGRWCFFRDQFWTPLFSSFETNLGSILGTSFAQNPSRRSTFPTPFSIQILISFWSTLGSHFRCFLAPFLDLFFIFL